MTQRRIVIVGFMGSGKTIVARALAARLDCKMIDLDSFIEEREGRSPAQILQQDGEPVFRRIETVTLRDILEPGNARVIALGGGAWTIEANRSLVSERDCVSVWLDAPFDLCWERISSHGKVLRPLAPDRETATRLFESRRKDYGLASIRIQVGQVDAAETLANKILDGIRD
jgi:shikimate kinase